MANATEINDPVHRKYKSTQSALKPKRSNIYLYRGMYSAYTLSVDLRRLSRPSHNLGNMERWINLVSSGFGIQRNCAIPLKTPGRAHYFSLELGMLQDRPIQ